LRMLKKEQMSSRKRGADKQITKDDNENDEEAEKGQFQSASHEKLEKREMVKVKRKGPHEDNAAFPKFEFGAQSTQAPNPLDKFRTHANQWECPDCGLVNENSSTKCKSCEHVRTAAPTPAKPAATTNATSTTSNALDKFRLKSNQWECPTCAVANESFAEKCKSCEVPKPSQDHKEGGKKAKTDSGSEGFTFGAQPSSGFTFGSESAPTFNFGGTESSDPSENKFVFQWSDSSTDSGGFTFGAGSASNAVSFGSFDPDGTTGFSAGDIKFDGNETQSLASVTSETVDLFKGKTAEASGEENDVVKHTVSVKLFQQKLAPKKTPAEGEGSTDVETELRYVEAGSGDLRVNVTMKNSVAVAGRLVLRMDKTQRLLLNAAILPSMKPVTEDKWVRFSSMSSEMKLEHFGLKLRSKEEANHLAAAINEAIKSIKK